MDNQQSVYTMRRIGGLLFRRVHDQLTEAESDTLDTWLSQQDSASRKFFEEITDWDEIQVALNMMYEFDVDAAFADVQKKIEAEAARIAPVVSLAPTLDVRRVGRYRRFFVAATAATIVAGGIFYYKMNVRPSKNENVIAPISERYMNDIAPGGDKAILELADGSKITLEDASSGLLAKQGNTKVVKTADAQISYDPGKSGNTEVSYNVITTPKGGQFQIRLSDGTKVWLNAESSLRFPTSFSGDVRGVELKGQAYFVVAKGASSPFKVTVNRSVQASPMIIDVLGTEFDVMAYSNEEKVKTTLIKGAVKVEVGGWAVGLKPGQQSVLKSADEHLKVDTVVDLEKVTAWKEGLFILQDDSIEDIMRLAERWYNIDVEYKGKVTHKFFGTIPRRVNISTMLKILEATGNVHFEVDGKKVVILP